MIRRSQFAPAFRSGTAVLALGLAGLAACVSARECRGGYPLAALECGAAQGNQDAEFTLGQLLESSDPARAARLYRDAGAFTLGTNFIYAPGVGNDPGSLMTVSSGPDRAGLPQAQYRLGLMYLEGRGVKADRKHGMRLIESAAKAGFAPAVQTLDALRPNHP